MPTISNPVEFTHTLDNAPEPRRGLQRCGNRVKLEGDDNALISQSNPLFVSDVWILALQADETADDSDKSLAVPAASQWQVLWIWVELATTADVGDRQLVVEIQDASNDVIAQWRAGTTQAASLTRYYCFAPANADLTDFRDTDYLMTPIPPTLILPTGYQVRIYDNNTVAAAADDMTVQMMVAQRSI